MRSSSQPGTLRHMLNGTVVYSIALYATKAASFVLLPVYTRYLTPSDYGALELLTLTAFILTTLVFMRYGDALAYFHGRTSSPENAAAVIWTLFVSSFLMGVACALVGCSASSVLSRIVFATDKYTFHFHLVFLGAICSFPVEMGYAYLRLLNRSRLYIIVSFVNLMLGIAFNVLLLIRYHLGIFAMLWSSLAVTSLTALILGVTICRDVWRTRRFDPSIAREVVVYSCPLGFSGLGMFALNFGDRYFLMRHVTLAEVGIYALAYKIGMLVSYVQAPFSTYWWSQMYAIMRRSDGPHIHVRVCTYVTVVLGTLALALSLCSGPLLHLTVAEPYWAAAPLVPWIAAAYVVRAVGTQFRCVFFLMGETRKELLVTGAGGIVCVLAYAIAIPRYGVWGAAVATIIGFLCMCIVGLWQAQKVRYFPFEYTRMAIFLAGAFAVVLIFRNIHIGNAWIHLSLGGAIVVGYLVALILFRFVTPEELEALRGVFRGALASGGKALPARA